MDVFFFEAFEEEALSLQKAVGKQLDAGYSWKTIQEFEIQNPPCEIISVRTQSIIPPAWLPHLTGILTRSTGFDHLIRDVKEFQKSIQLGYLPLYCNRSVAEQALLLWMSLLRKLPRQMNQFEKFHRDGLTGFECQDKTLLVVGVGNIGSEIVKIGQGLGMTVLGVDLIEKHDFVDYTTISESIQRADIIVAAMNLTRQNKGYFNYQLLSQCKPTSIFVNIARGELSPSSDLKRLLDDHRISGVAMDVFDNEGELAVVLRSKPEKANITGQSVKDTIALKDYPNVILTPHNAFNTFEGLNRKVQQSIDSINHFRKEGSFIWPVKAK